MFYAGYVLMQRIFPSPQNTAFLRNGKLEVLPSITELGIFGTFVGYGSSSSLSAVATESTEVTSTEVITEGGAATPSDIVSPILNNYGGYLVRTKPLGVDEGGVATGYSVLNSIVLE